MKTDTGKFIQVFEYEKLRYDDSGHFRKQHFDAMVRFNELHQNKYFSVIHKGIRFGSYVGVLQVGGLTIEILPKADRNENADKALWQAVLLDMLRVCKHITVDTVSETQLRKRYNSVLDVYFELFLNEVDQLVRRGLIKKYRKKESNQTVLKGKLLFAKNIRENLVHKERFYCEHQTYDRNHLLHQILYKALTVLNGFVKPELRDKLNRLCFEFQDVELVDIQKKDFERIVIDRKNKDYERALDIARIILLNYSPSLNYGNENLLTLLFDMNALWEEYIFRILHKHKPAGTEVSFQNSAKFWENKRIRPDIVVKTENEVFVIDTKWKIIDSANPSDADLKQMFVYNLHWQAEKSMLLYPQLDQTDTDFGNYYYGNLGKKCKLGFVSMVGQNRIRDSRILADEIFDKLIQSASYS